LRKERPLSRKKGRREFPSKKKGKRRKLKGIFPEEREEKYEAPKIAERRMRFSSNTREERKVISYAG